MRSSQFGEHPDRSIICVTGFATAGFSPIQASASPMTASAAGTVVIDMSSISPDATRRLAARVAERGGSMLDAPVSGGEILEPLAPIRERHSLCRREFPIHPGNASRSRRNEIGQISRASERSERALPDPSNG